MQKRYGCCCRTGRLCYTTKLRILMDTNEPFYVGRIKMKTNMIISIIFILFIIAAFAIGISKNDNEQIRYELIPNSKIPETLNTIFNKVENNYKLIKTWEGKVISEIDYIYEGKAAEKMFKSSTLGIGEVPKSIINSIETVIEFSLDAENEYVFTYNYPA